MHDPRQPNPPQTSANLPVDAAAGDVRAQPPEEFTGLRTTPPKEAAVGAASVFAAMRHVWREMGISRGLRGLLALNQPGGIDCMSCAGPIRTKDGASSSSAKTAPKPWPGRVTWTVRAPSSSPGTAWPNCRNSRTIGWASRDVSRIRWCFARATRTIEPIAWDEAFSLIAAELDALAIARRGDLLYLRPDQQRGRLPVSVVRAPVRHQQPARLLEHVPRIERRGPVDDHRHRQGDRHARTTSTRPK